MPIHAKQCYNLFKQVQCGVQCNVREIICYRKKLDIINVPSKPDYLHPVFWMFYPVNYFNKNILQTKK